MTVPSLDLSDLGVELKAPAELPTTTGMAIYGEPGSGKTWLAASAVEVEELSPVLFLDTENSAAAVADKYKDNPNIKVAQLKDWNTTRQVLSRVMRGDHGYKTVVLDTVNGIQSQLQLHMIQRAELKRRLQSIPPNRLTAEQRSQLTSLAGVKLIENTNNSLGESTTSLTDYGVLGTKMAEIIVGYMQAEFFSIFVTHTHVDKDEQTGKLNMSPDMSGRIAKRELGGKPHILAHMSLGYDSEGGTRTMARFRNSTVGNTLISAKDRLGVLPPTMNNPSLPDIWAHINK